MEEYKALLLSYADSVRLSVQPHLDSAISLAQPHIDTAINAVQPHIDNVVNTITPHYNSIIEIVTPHVTTVYEASNNVISVLEPHVSPIVEVSKPYTLPLYDYIIKNVEFNDAFYNTIYIIFLCPLIWNIVARFEYYTSWNRFWLSLCFGKNNSKYITCYIFTCWIFTFSGYRDYLYTEIIKSQVHVDILPEYVSNQIENLFVGVDLTIVNEYLVAFGLSTLNAHLIVGLLLILIGQVLVISSFLRLGITGTFLGDYCGIYMKERVYGFPFNVTNNPMYNGSTLTFLGTAVINKSVVGLVLTFVVYVVYQIALMFEEPFTGMIYANVERQKKTAIKIAPFKAANKKHN